MKRRLWTEFALIVQTHFHRLSLVGRSRRSMATPVHDEPRAPPCCPVGGWPRRSPNLTHRLWIFGAVLRLWVMAKRHPVLTAFGLNVRRRHEAKGGRRSHL